MSEQVEEIHDVAPVTSGLRMGRQKFEIGGRLFRLIELRAMLAEISREEEVERLLWEALYSHARGNFEERPTVESMSEYITDSKVAGDIGYY